MIKPSDTFEIEVDGHLGTGTLKSLPVLQWLNIQHIGQPNTSLDINVKYSKEHTDATWRLMACRRFKLTIKVNKKGEWTVIKVNGKKVEQ